MPSTKQTQLGIGQIAIIGGLVALLIATALWGLSAWNVSSGVAMGKHGWIALGLGTFFSLLVGCGLMALMFFSSRSGHDDAADPFRRSQLPPPADPTLPDDKQNG
jgi:hypothetical protein